MIYQLKITLLKVKKPAVWRRVLVNSDETFDYLHLVIQDAMGWEDCHLYAFGYREYDRDFNISVPSPDDWDRPTHNSLKTRIKLFLNDAHPKMRYVYDFGDDWVHEIVLERKFNDDEINHPLPFCLAAKGACPPEDCHGPWGYEDLKQLAASNPTDDDSLERLEWFGIDEDFDPNHVDIDLINRDLARLRPVTVTKKKVDPKKLEERKSVLRTLTSGFCNSKLNGVCSDICESIIESMAAGKYNITGGRAEIWAAAIVLVATEYEMIDISRDEIYAYFGVKAAGVLSRVTEINDQSLSDFDDAINSLTPEQTDTLFGMLGHFQKTGELPPEITDFFDNLPDA